MRKLVPIISASIATVFCTSALALGDMNKNKKAASVDTTAQGKATAGGSTTASVSDSGLSKSGAPSGNAKSDAPFASGGSANVDKASVKNTPVAGGSTTASVSDKGLGKSGASSGTPAGGASSAAGGTVIGAAPVAEEVKTKETIRDSGAANPTTSRPDSTGGERSPGPVAHPGSKH